MSSAFRNVIVAAMAVCASQCSKVFSFSADDSRTLRVCSDPNNLPFSNQKLEGFENKIAALVADRLHAKLEYVWWAQRRGFLRNTLRAGKCDVVVGLPSHIDMALTTVPYYRSSYMFVTRKGTHQPQSFDDPYLTKATVGVQLIGDDFANSPPAHALSNRGLISNVRGYSVYGDYRQPHPPSALIDAVAKGDIDVAVAWGPMAGYFARSAPVPLQLTPVHPAEEPPFPFVFDISMGVSQSNRTLRDELNGVITQHRPAIDAILREFAVPLVETGKAAAR